MKGLMGKATVSVVVSLMTAAMALSAGQQGGAQRGAAPAAPAAQPEKAPRDAKAILSDACTFCHSLDRVQAAQYPTKDEYTTLVNGMVSNGADVSKAEVPILAEYLFTTYGAGGGDKSAPAAAAGAADPDAAGKMTLETSCTVCHDLKALSEKPFAAVDQYQKLVISMIGYGANVKDSEVEPLVNYIFKTYGKK